MSLRTKECKKQVFKYPVGVHGPFGHVCASKRRSGATCKHHNQQHVTTNHTSPTDHHHPHLTIMVTGQNECKTGSNDTSHHLGPGKFFSLLFFFHQLIVSFWIYRFFLLMTGQLPSHRATTPTQHHHPAYKPLLMEGAGVLTEEQQQELPLMTWQWCHVTTTNHPPPMTMTTMWQLCHITTANHPCQHWTPVPMPTLDAHANANSGHQR